MHNFANHNIPSSCGLISTFEYHFADRLTCHASCRVDFSTLKVGWYQVSMLSPLYLCRNPEQGRQYWGRWNSSDHSCSISPWFSQELSVYYSRGLILTPPLLSKRNVNYSTFISHQCRQSFHLFFIDMNTITNTPLWEVYGDYAGHDKPQSRVHSFPIRTGKCIS